MWEKTALVPVCLCSAGALELIPGLVVGVAALSPSLQPPARPGGK